MAVMTKQIPIQAPLQVDRLHQIRQQIRVLEAEERQLTTAVREVMVNHELRVLDGRSARAHLDARVLIAVDVLEFVTEVGSVKAAAPALCVSLPRAREILGPDRLARVGVTDDSRIVESLRVVAIERA